MAAVMEVDTQTITTCHPLHQVGSDDIDIRIDICTYVHECE